MNRWPIVVKAPYLFAAGNISQLITKPNCLNCSFCFGFVYVSETFPIACDALMVSLRLPLWAIRNKTNRSKFAGKFASVICFMNAGGGVGKFSPDAMVLSF